MSQMIDEVEKIFKELEAAIYDKLRDEWAENSLNDACMNLEDPEWTPGRLGETFDVLAKALGGKKTAEVFIAYMFGWLLLTGRADVWDGKGDESTFIRTDGDPYDPYGQVFELGNLNAGDLIIKTNIKD